VANRNEILNNFTNNEKLYELSGLSPESLNDISFKPDPAGDVLVESLKKLIFSYCKGEAKITVIKNINIEIEKNL
jgi:hypothetical protein